MNTLPTPIQAFESLKYLSGLELNQYKTNLAETIVNLNDSGHQNKTKTFEKAISELHELSAKSFLENKKKKMFFLINRLEIDENIKLTMKNYLNWQHDCLVELFIKNAQLHDKNIELEIKLTNQET